MKIGNHRIYLGDNVEILKRCPVNFIDLTVTSPPYDNAREYKGFSWDFEALALQLYRITKKGGVVVWVVNDSTINGSESCTSFKQALFFKEDCGFNLHDTMIYKKNNYLPLNHNRYDPEFEFMFVFSKGKPKSFNPLMTKCTYFGSSKSMAIDTSGSASEDGCARRARDEKIVFKEFKYRGNVWGYDTGKHKGTKDDVWMHPATFPEKLADDHIQSWSNAGDVVLDPFMGSATTGKMAVLSGRKFIGIDIAEEYFELSRKRLERAVANKAEADARDRRKLFK